MVRQWIAGLLLVLLAMPAQAQFIIVTGPAQPPVPFARPGNYGNVRTVAVLSGIGQTLTLERAIVLLPQIKKLDISGWGYDDAITALIKKHLAARFEIKDVDYDKSALALIPDRFWESPNLGLRAKFQPGAGPRVLRAPPQQDIDAYIIVRPARTGPAERGLSLTSGDVLKLLAPKDEVLEWASYRIDVWNARTLTRIGTSESRLQIRKGSKPTWTGLYADKSLTLDDKMSPTDQQFARLRTDFSRTIASSVVETLRSLELGIDLPEIGERTIERLSLDKDPFADIKTIGLVSAIGNELLLRHLGGTRFSQSENALPIPDWQVDRDVEKIARSALGKRFTIKDIDFDRAALAQARFLDGDGKWVSAVPALKPSQDVDAYVVILKHPLRLGRSVFDGAGVGVWNHSLPAAREETAIFANYAIALVDARTLELIVGLVGTMDTSVPIRKPYKLIDNGLWRASAPLSSETSSEVQETLTSLFANSVPETLLRLQLTGSVIAGGLPSPQ